MKKKDIQVSDVSRGVMTETGNIEQRVGCFLNYRDILLKILGTDKSGLKNLAHPRSYFLSEFHDKFNAFN